MTQVSEQEVEAAANALCGFRFPRAVKDPRILELIRAEARAALTAAAQVRREQEGSLVQATTEPAEASRDHPGMVRSAFSAGFMAYWGPSNMAEYDAMEKLEKEAWLKFEKAWKSGNGGDLGPIPIYGATEDTPAERMLDRTRLKAIADRIVDDYRPPATEDTPPKGEG